MTINLSSLSGSSNFTELAPDLTWPDSKSSNTTGYKEVTGINASAGLTTALSLSGKFLISSLFFKNLTSETCTFKLTIDGVVIWNDAVSTTATQALYGLFSSADGTAQQNANTETGFICIASFLLEVQTASDTNITLVYLARPIL